MRSPTTAALRSGSRRRWPPSTRTANTVVGSHARRPARSTARAAVIVAVPLNTLDAIEFTPAAVGDAKRATAADGQSSHGVKTWIRVRGEHGLTRERRAGRARARVHEQPEYTVGGDTLMVGFGPDAGRLDPTDPPPWRGDLDQLLPEARGGRTSHAHDWTADQYSRGTWSMYRPGSSPARCAPCSRRRGACCWPAPTSPAAGTASSTAPGAGTQHVIQLACERGRSGFRRLAGPAC